MNDTVTWKFWRWRGLIRTERLAAQQIRVCYEEILERHNQSRRKANAEIERLKTALESKPAVYQRTPAIVGELAMKNANLERLLVLAGMARDNPLWLTILSYADEHERNEMAIAMTPNLDDAARHYNAGRAAGAHDFSSALRDLRVNADLAARQLTKDAA